MTDAQEIVSGSTSLVFSDGVGTQSFNSKIQNIAAGDSSVQYFDLTNDGTDDLVQYKISGDFDGNGKLGSGADVRLASSPEMTDTDGMTVLIEQVNADGSSINGSAAFLHKISGDTPTAANFADYDFGNAPGSSIGPVSPGETIHYKVTTTLSADEVEQNKDFLAEYTFSAVQDTDAS